ncbi:MAG: phosphatidylserine decarboxylase family protein [Candidatus Zixiibacteriota bacterium]
MAKDGLTICLGMLTVTFLVWGLFLFDQRTIPLAAGTVSAILTALFFYFFRDPKREIPSGENLLVSPADGKVVAVKKLTSHEFLQSEAVQISIFLSPLDVHINRVPAAGNIEYVKYKSGRFLAAYNDLASDENEQTEIGLTTNNGSKIVFKQIAGWMARRIVCRLEKGQKVITGEKFGMIKFGSRTDLIVPSDTQIEVTTGQHVTGGETIIGRLKMTSLSQSGSTSARKSNV